MAAELYPSILSADFMRLGEQVQITREENIRTLHVDVMDGVFVPSISFGFPVIDSLAAQTDQHLDIHLMIVKPERYIERFAKYRGSTLTVHAEACPDLPAVVRQIRAAGCLAGAAISPETDCSAVYPVLDLLDEVIVMTVHPGFGGQKMIEEVLDKAGVLRREMEKRGLKTGIATDGGITRGNIRRAVDAGFDRIVCGSAVFRGDIRQNIRALRAELPGESREE